MIDIRMPRLSDTMEDGVVAAWLKKPGDAVAEGDVLVEIETDKAVMEFEAYEAGILAAILVPEGGNAPIGAVIARLDDGSGDGGGGAGAERNGAAAGGRGSADGSADGGAPADGSPGGSGGARARGAGTAPQAGDAASTAPFGAAGAGPRNAADTAPPAAERRFASPLVRRLARERGVDLASVPGSGPGGRIVRRDLEEASARPPAVRAADAAAPAPTDRATADEREPTAVPFDAARRTSSRRLTESSTTTPQFSVTAAADVGELLALRQRLNAALAASAAPTVSVNDLVVRACALALRAHPGVNASYSPEDQGATLLHGRVHIGIAVAAPGGLVVPVIRDADRAPVSRIAAVARRLAARAHERKLGAEDFAAGTFTVSNLGMYGVEHFTAIVNPPQGAILAVGAAAPEPAVVDGAVAVRRRMRCTLSADHRIIDGALAAEFLATLTGLLENPLRVVA